MYITRVKLTNIRSIRSVEWSIDARDAPGWHVIIGNNGSGKSTFLRGIALALVGPTDAYALRQNWSDWLHTEEEQGSLEVTVHRDPSYDRWTGKGRILNDNSLPLKLHLKRHGSGNGAELSVSSSTLSTAVAKRHVWGDGGWFSVSYGPFRRFTGGDKEWEKLFFSHPRLARHLSIFGEDIALTESVEWLQRLRFKELEKDLEASVMLKDIRDFVNQEGLIPCGAKLEEITSQRVTFRDGDGNLVAVNQLSDGFRSILSLTFELIRQLYDVYEPQDVFTRDGSETTVPLPGVVLIDEIDAHLHPSWQRDVGQWFTRHFPKLQFLVTTHSPLVCQAAENGTIFRLPTPGAEHESAGMVTGTEKERLVYGDILDAYGTEMFGDRVGRSDSSGHKLASLARLNQKAVAGELTDTEAQERVELQALFSSQLTS